MIMPVKKINPYRNTTSFPYYNVLAGSIIATFLVASTLAFFLVAGLLDITDFFVLGGIFSFFVVVLLILTIVFKFSPIYQTRKIHSIQQNRKMRGSRSSVSSSRLDLNATFTANSSHTNLQSKKLHIHQHTLRVPMTKDIQGVGFSGSDRRDMTEKISISPAGSTTNVRLTEQRRPESVIIDMKARHKSATISTISR